MRVVPDSASAGLPVDLWEDDPEERAAVVAESNPDAADPLLAVVARCDVRGWPSRDCGGRAAPARLSRALVQRYGTDAHVSQYRCPAIGRRLDRAAPAALAARGEAVKMAAIMFDVDCPAAHGPSAASDPNAVDAWWSVERAKVAPLATFGYRTRGGYRLAFWLPAEHVIATPDDAAAWAGFYLASVAYLRRVHDIAVDPLGDWQRLFRLPHSTRLGSSAPEDRETIGDPALCGVWMPRLTAADYETGATLRRRPRPHKPGVRGPSDYSGRGLLYELFAAQGWLGRAIGEDRIAVRCPRDEEHTHRGCDGSTVLWLPGAGEEVGWLHCSHTSRGHHLWTVRDVLGYFGAADIEHARRMAGIPGRAAA